ncbi:MAG: hypothetical protein DCC75_10405 [Proteobacteria bacterium]|nr:MAG: hypothetical protein DCC75_10405 [Pseudomonadota bacterium]
MAITLTCLVIHTTRDLVEKVTQALWPEIQFTKSDFTASLTEAFQLHYDNIYNICFVSNAVVKDLDVFFRDMEKMGRLKTCAFIQVFDKLPPNFNRADSIARGFTGVITQEVTSEERTLLKEILKIEYHNQQVRERVHDVGTVAKILTEEIDRVAKEKLRGREEKLDKLLTGFVELQAEFDDQILGEYFEHLTAETEKAKSFEKKKVAIPAKVLKRKLPKLEDNKYSGASSRVWGMLLDKFGTKDGEQPPSESHSESEQISEAPPAEPERTAQEATNEGAAKDSPAESADQVAEKPPKSSL